MAAGLCLIAGIQNASAQVDDPVEFTTAFPFTVGYGTVPAGSYTIRPDDDNPGILELQGRATTVFFQAQNTEARKAPSETEVVFKHYGDSYILKDIWVAGSSTGAETLVSEGERHATKQYGSASEERVQARKLARASTNE
jgi:hypothetical protein